KRAQSEVEPSKFVTWTQINMSERERSQLGKVKVRLLAPTITVPLVLHVKLGIGLAQTGAMNRAVSPTNMETSAKGVMMTGALSVALTVRKAGWLRQDPVILLTITSYWPSSVDWGLKMVNFAAVAPEIGWPS